MSQSTNKSLKKPTSETNMVKSLAKGVSHSPRKVSEVAALVRNRTVEDALVILSHTPRRSATAVIKAIASAKANAEHNHNLKPDTLRITEITVTAGPRIKRFRPAAHGRALPFQRKTSHIRVIVTGDERQKKNAAVASTAQADKKTATATKPVAAKITKPAATSKPAATKTKKVSK
jgi:large subunit ribosomal protein L22